MSKKAPRAQPKTVAGDPFLFFGQGFGTSARALECYLWFANPPGERSREWMRRRLPFPVSSFARFHGEVLHFGSDDELEARISAAYHPDYAGRDPEQALDDARVEHPEPGSGEWKAFCADFEEMVLKAHERNKLIAVLKPDDGTYGRRPGPWHRRSLARAAELAERASRGDATPRGVWSALAMNLLEEVLPTSEAAKKLSAASRMPWLAWLDQLVSTGDRALRDAFVERAAWVLDAMPVRERTEALATLGPGTARAVRSTAGAALEQPGTQKAPSKPAKAARPAAKVPPTTKKAASASRSSTRKAEPGSSAKGSGNPVAMLRPVLIDVVVPRLHQRGFEGKFPKLRRITDQRTHVMWFSLDPGWYAKVQVGLGVVAPRTDTTIEEDYRRAFDARNSQALLTDLVSPDDRILLWYEDAATKWGSEWPHELAEHLLGLLEKDAERWLASRNGGKRKQGRG